MATESVGSYQRTTYTREPDPQEVRERQRQEEPAAPSPEKAREQSMARNRKPAVKSLGGRIDVYA